MAKLMAPNIRIDWYPDGHFADPANPTLAELNSGYNLSPAIVTGFTLDFTDSETVSRANIFEEFAHETISHFSYEANLQFFLAPRLDRIYDFGKTDTENEAAYRKAEELFYHNQNVTGYFVKRIGYKWNVDYSAGQKIDIFHVQSIYPKLTVEDNRPILLEVSFLPLGFAVSSAYAGVIRYEWLGEPHNSPSVKMVDGEIVARNIIPDPRLLQEGSTTTTANTVGGRAPRDGMFPELGNKIGDDVFYFGSVENPTGSVYASSGLQNSPYLEKDKWYAGSIWVHTIDHMTPNPDRFNMQFRSAANPTWGSRVAEVHPSGMKRIVVSGKVEADNPQTWWVFWPYELRDYIGEYVYVGALQLSGPSDTEQEALEQVETYFDGDSNYNG